MSVVFHEKQWIIESFIKSGLFPAEKFDKYVYSQITRKKLQVWI